MTYNVFGGTLNLAQSAKFDICSSLSAIISNSAACYTRRLLTVTKYRKISCRREQRTMIYDPS